MAKPLKSPRPPHKERVYVKVNSDFDATGYIQPRSITWADGRTFQIEAVKDYRPASWYRKGVEGACYTVTIRGEEKHLFLEWMDSTFASRIARWYVETMVNADVYGEKGIMMNADYYIVQVQDFGELLEYRFNDYTQARHLMDVEALPCSLWACCRASDERVQLENRMAR